MSFNPNSKKHKATHGGYRKKPTKAQVQANIAFWDLLTPDGYKNDSMNFVLASPGFGTPRLGTPVGTQLKMKL